VIILLLTCTRTCTRPCSRHVHGSVTAVYTARTLPCTRPPLCTRIHSPYAKPIEFATFSQTLVTTLLNKAKKHHIACHRKCIKYGVNGIWNKDSVFTDAPYYTVIFYPDCYRLLLKHFLDTNYMPHWLHYNRPNCWNIKHLARYFSTTFTAH